MPFDLLVQFTRGQGAAAESTCVMPECMRIFQAIKNESLHVISMFHSKGP